MAIKSLTLIAALWQDTISCMKETLLPALALNLSTRHNSGAAELSKINVIPRDTGLVWKYLTVLYPILPFWDEVVRNCKPGIIAEH